MPSITNALLAQQMSELLDAWRTRELEMREWISGAADGGPFEDGRFPLTDYLGATRYTYSPAALESGVAGSASAAASSASDAATAATTAGVAQAAAEAAAALSLTRLNGAQAARDLAESYRDEAANSEANALVHRNAAAASATAAAGSATAADASADEADTSSTEAAGSASAAASSAAAAAASAAAAATFDPANFYTKTAADARYRQLSVSLAISDVTSLQTTLDGKLSRAVNVWQTSTDGSNRLYFSNAGRTYYRSPDGHEFRGASDQTLGRFAEDGYLYLNGWISLPNASGLFTAAGDYWYPDNANYWLMNSPNGMKVGNRAGTVQGYLYHSGGAFGLLDSAAVWKVQVNTSGVTLYGSTYLESGLYHASDTSFYLWNTGGYTYGSWRIGGSRGGYTGLVLDDGTSRKPTFMSSGTSAGIFDQGTSAWHYYAQLGLFRIGSSFTPYFDGGPGALLYHSGSQTSGKITLSTSAASGTPANGDIWIQHDA